MHDRVMNWLRRAADRVRYPGQSVQYELHRMTHKGGWKNVYTDPAGIAAETFPTPPPKPSFGEDTGWPPGRYRCLRRVNGRIESTLWTMESPDVDAYYERLRAQATDTDSDTGTAATDGGTATKSNAADTTQPTDAAAASDADTDAAPSPLVQELMADVQQGSTPALVGLWAHVLLSDAEAESDDET